MEFGPDSRLKALSMRVATAPSFVIKATDMLPQYRSGFSKPMVHDVTIVSIEHSKEPFVKPAT